MELLVGRVDAQLIAADQRESDETELRESHVQLGYTAKACLRAPPRYDAVLLAYVLQRVKEPVGVCGKMSIPVRFVYFDFI